MHIDMERELRRTEPDYVVFKPGSLDGSSRDTGNEHFLVFDGPDGGLLAVWTQSTIEGRPDQRIVFSRSDDKGETWRPPRVVAGPASTGGTMASWGFPLVSQSGRIYVIYSRHIGVNDIFTHTTGLMACIFSDDAGESWSVEQVIPMPRSRWDNPDPNVPSNWIVWQKPERLSEGRYFAGFTRWVSPAVRPAAPIKVWWAEASVVEFMRFENIDDDPEPRDIEISYFMSDDQALHVGLVGHPDVSVVQEPSIVALPDGRLFCILRTTTGHPFYTVSNDAGRTWRKPEVLRRSDDGPALLHPCSPCPIYDIGGGRCVLFYHNHDGHFDGWGPMETSHHRRPINLALGEYRSEARQPIWFSEPKFLFDNDGVPLGYGGGRCDLAMYASMTFAEGTPVLWYPERKFFLLGKRITDETLEGLQAPLAD